MSEQKAQMYDQLVRQHTAVQNAINRIPQLSIEEQSKLVDINERYSPENQVKVNQMRNELMQIEQRLKSMF
jgi:hypothetical protein|tara:strand:- start:11 stop:223 length:213 start_codon:yes stop_codon:yes gene_type:complete